MTTSSSKTDAAVGAELRFADDIGPELRQRVHALIDDWSIAELRGPVDVTRLAGGASNINLLLAGAASSFALRICMPDSARWGVDRAAAIQAQRDAAALGVAPRVVAHALPAGHYLSEFVEGTVLTGELIRAEGLLPDIAATLRRLNSGSTTARIFSPFHDMRTFVELGAAEGAHQPAALDQMLAVAFRIEALFENRAAPRAFCHSDLVPQNFIRTPDGFKLVDFDYAGTGWVAFEMASFCCQAELDAADTETFLRAYDPVLDDSQRARVELMRFVAGVREAAWACMAESILSEHTSPMPGWSYTGYAEANLAQAGTVVDRGLAELVDAARWVRTDAGF